MIKKLLFFLLFTSCIFGQEWQFIAKKISPDLQISISQIDGLTNDTLSIVDTSFSIVDTVYQIDTTYLGSTDTLYYYDTTFIYNDVASIIKRYNLSVSPSGISISIAGTEWYEVSIECPSDTVWISNESDYPSDDNLELIPKESYNSGKLLTYNYPTLYLKTDATAKVQIIIRSK